MPSHDDHFHCLDKPGVRTDTHRRAKAGPPDITFYGLKQDLAALEARSGGRAKLQTLGTTPGRFGGRDILMLRVGSSLDLASKPKALFLGGIHAREWLGISYTYLIAEWLLDNYPSGAPAGPAQTIAKQLVDGFELHFIPLCNPDGHEYTVTIDRLFRKNSPAGDPRFSSTPGLSGDLGVQAGAPESIDLNRNFVTPNRAAVLAAGPNGVWNLDVTTDLNAGAGVAFETKLLQDLMKAQSYQLVVDHHTYGCWCLPAPGDDAKASVPRFDRFGKLCKAQLDTQSAKNPTTRPGTPDTWTNIQSAKFYALLKPAAFPTGIALMPGATDDFAYWLTKPPGQTLALTLELPPMLYPGTPAFDPDETVIRPAFKSVLATTLALIANCMKSAPTAADFAPFLAVP